MTVWQRSALVGLLLGVPSAAWCNPPEAPTARRSLFSVQVPAPSSEAYLEARRQENVTRQIQLQDQVRWLQGLPPRQSGGAGPVVQPSLDYIYSGAAFGPPTGWPVPFIFEPWPFVPGDIWGVPYIDSVPQSTGYKITPTGPNGYIYQPTFSTPKIPAMPLPSASTLPIGPSPVPLPAPAAPSSELRAAPAEELPSPAPRVLREF